MNIDIEAIRLDIYRHLGVPLGKTDPVLHAALFNATVLNAIAERMASILEKSQNEVSASGVQQVAAAKETAERLITQAGAFVHQQTEAAFETATQNLIKRLDRFGHDLDLRLREADIARRSSFRIGLATIAAAIVSFMFMAAGLAHRFLH